MNRYREKEERNIKKKKYLLLAFCILGFSQISLAAPHIDSGTGTGSVIIADAPSELGTQNTADGEYSSAIGVGNTASGKYSSAFGYGNRATGKFSSAFGTLNKATEEKSFAFGIWNTATGKYSSAFGYKNTAAGLRSSTFGIWNTATGEKSSVFGSEYEVTGDQSGAWGVGEYSSGYTYKNEGRESYMLGNRNKIAAGTEHNFILGNDVSIGAGISHVVVLGDGSEVGESYTVSVGSAAQKRKIVNVADGVDDSDAATFGQLKSYVAAHGGALDTYTKAESDNKFAGKDASNLSASDVAVWKTKLGVGSGGSGGIANTATGTGSTGFGHGNAVTGEYSTAVGYQNNVSGNHSGAFGDPNTISGNHSYAVGNDNTIAGDNNFVLGNNVNIVAGIQNSVALGNNSTVSASNEVSVGSASQKRKITNVADGEISATSSDAVTGKQLFELSKNMGVQGLEEARKDIKRNRREMRGIGSLSAALAGLHPMQYDKNAPSQVMAALGNYKDKQAIAVGVSHYFTPNAMMRAGVALSNEKRTNVMANVGFTWKLGKGGSQAPMENASVVQSEVRRLTLENQEQKVEIARQGKENQELKSQVNNQNQRIQKLEEALNTLLKK